MFPRDPRTLPGLRQGRLLVAYDPAVGTVALVAVLGSLGIGRRAAVADIGRQSSAPAGTVGSVVPIGSGLRSSVDSWLGRSDALHSATTASSPGGGVYAAELSTAR
jgi:hypothetical protein